MSPDSKAFIIASPLILLSLLSSFIHMGGMRITGIEIESSTPSIERAILPLKGCSYISKEMSEAVRRIDSLCYIDSTATSFSDGTVHIVPEYRDGGILALSSDGLFLVFSDSADELDLRDIPQLLSIYPSVYIDDEELRFFESFGFDHEFFAREAEEGNRASSIRHALDDNVSDKGVADSAPLGFEG